MLIVVGLMVLGIILGYLLRRSVLIVRTVEKLTSVAIYLLLFLLGISIGTNQQIMAHLHTIGLNALIITCLSVLGSITLALPVYRLFFKQHDDNEEVTGAATKEGVTLGSLRGSLIILIFFTLGVILGYFHWLPHFVTATDYSSYALYLLMTLVGMGIGTDDRALKALRTFNLRIVLVPVTTIVGTLLGTCLAFVFFTSLRPNELLAISAGYGYYSLSSIIISELGRPELGVIALLSNVMREILTLLCSPFFARYFGKLAPIVAGGATSMDTTLPIIAASSGKHYAIVSLFHGIVLTILVPFIVTFFMSIG